MPVAAEGHGMIEGHGAARLDEGGAEFFGERAADRGRRPGLPHHTGHAKRICGPPLLVTGAPLAHRRVATGTADASNDPGTLPFFRFAVLDDKDQHMIGFKRR
jgi:hypothetical protein